MSEKTTLLSEAETAFTLFKRAIAGLDEAQMRQVWLGHKIVCACVRKRGAVTRSWQRFVKT